MFAVINNAELLHSSNLKIFLLDDGKNYEKCQISLQNKLFLMKLETYFIYYIYL